MHFLVKKTLKCMTVSGMTDDIIIIPELASMSEE